MARELIKNKWITPLVQNIGKLPQTIINDFVNKLGDLCHKYDNTFSDVETQIKDTEKSLVGLIDQLTGNDFDMKGLAELKTLLGGK